MKDLSLFLNDNNIKNELLFGEVPNENEDNRDDVKTREKLLIIFIVNYVLTK